MECLTLLITREDSAWYYRFYFPAINITIVTEGNDRTSRRILMTLDDHSFTSESLIVLFIHTADTLCTILSSSWSIINYIRNHLAKSQRRFSRSSLIAESRVHYSFLTRSLIRAIQSVGQSILFEVNVLTNKRGNLPPRRGSRAAEAQSNRANLVTTCRGSTVLRARDGYIRSSFSNLF